MKGLVFDVKRGVTRDGPGFRTSVFLKGCPLRCAWCHNPESQSPRIETASDGEVCGRRASVDELLEEVLRDAVFQSATGGGLTITGGEPLMQPDFAAELAAAAKGAGVHVALDTCGFAPWGAFEAVAPHVDLYLYDLKCMDAAKHRELTGADNAAILENLLRLDAAGAKTWIRCPLVPGLNDSDADLAALAEFTGRLKNAERVEICPYHPLGLAKYARFGKRAPFARAEPATKEEIARWQRALPNAQTAVSSKPPYQCRAACGAVLV